MPRFMALPAVLPVVVMLFASGCANVSPTTAAASGDHDGLTLDVHLHAASDSLIADTTVRNTRLQPVHLDADQCGRVTEVVLARTAFEPEGGAYGASLQAVKKLVLTQQRSSQAPDRFAPRRVEGGSDAPPCVRPTQPVELRPLASIVERWEQPFATAFGLAAVGSANEVVRAEAVESVAADRLRFLDILPTGDAEAVRTGRSVAVTLNTSAVLDRPPTRPVVAPSLGQRFDQMIEDRAVRDFIEAQPSDSWRRGTITATNAGRYEFRAVTTGFERAITATLEPDGAISGMANVPGPADHIRVFDRRAGTLPPGIKLIPDPLSHAVITDDVVADPVNLPSGRVVADAILNGEVEPLPDAAAPGRYPVHVTLVRFPDGGSDAVAFASLVVSDAPTIRWKQLGGIAVDGGTAAFTSAEGQTAMGELSKTNEAGWQSLLDAGYDSLTAHDDVITEAPITTGLDYVRFSTGFGDGVYPIHVGLDAAGKPTRFVIDFAIVHLDWPGS